MQAIKQAWKKQRDVEIKILLRPVCGHPALKLRTVQKTFNGNCQVQRIQDYLYEKFFVSAVPVASTSSSVPPQTTRTAPPVVSVKLFYKDTIVLEPFEFLFDLTEVFEHDRSLILNYKVDF